MTTSPARVETHRLEQDKTYPNNPKLPLLIYSQALARTGREAADEVQRRIESNRWGGTWQDGVFPYHHYHSNAHEVLAVCAGSAKLQFGGPGGPAVSVVAGDVVVLPAGTAHKRIDASPDFLVVGGYPAGQEGYDLIRELRSEKRAAQDRIANVPLPESDPIFGDDGPLLKHWSR